MVESKLTKLVKKNINIESEEILKGTLDASDQIIFVKNLKGVYILANTAFSVRFKKPRDQIIGKTDRDIFPLNEARRLRRIDREILKSGRRDSHEDVLTISGKKHIFKTTKVPLWNIEGSIVGLCGFAEDITEQRRAQQIRDAVYRIANAALKKPNLKELYLIIHNELKKLMNADNFYISLFDSEKNLIIFPYFVDENIKRRDPTEIVVRTPRKGLTEYILKIKKPKLIRKDDIRKLLKKGKVERIGKTPQVWLGAPLKDDKKVIGVVAVQDYGDENAYTKKDLQLLKFISNQISIAIERTRSTLALKNSEANYHTLAERSIQGIVIVQDYRIVYANRAFARIAGYSRKELLSLSVDSIKALVHPDDQKLVWDNWQKRLSGKKVSPRYQFRGVRKDGKIVWLEMFASRVIYNGRPAIQGSIIDITESKKNSERIEHLNKVLRAIRKVNQLIAKEKDEKRLLLGVCKALTERMGYRSVWIVTFHPDGRFKDIYSAGISRGLRTLISSLKRNKLPTCIKKAIRSSSILMSKNPEVECAGCFLSKTYSDTSAFTSSLYYRGKLYGALVVAIPEKVADSKEEQTLFREVAGDIAFALHSIELEEQKKQKDKIFEEEKKKIEKYLDITGSIIVALDRKGKVILVNRKGCETLGYGKDEIIGKDWFEIFVPEEFRRDAKKVFNRLKNREGAFYSRFENPVITKSGNQRTIVWNNTAIRDEKGKVVGVLSSGEDVTELRKTEEEMLKIEKLESLSVLAGGIAHDFNNILTGILGSISVARMLADPKSKLYEILQQTEKASLRAKDLTQQLLTFSKGGLPIKRKLSLGKLIREAAAFALRGSKLKCEFFIPDDLWPIEADGGQISQVIQNIVINADHATPESGVIAIRAENVFLKTGGEIPLDEGRYVKVSIEDYGVGIPKEYIKRVFDPYFTTKKKGSGLGLSVCFSIIKNHRGYITVDSELGVGTTFTFFLPAAESVPIEDKQEEKIHYGKGKILLMDDNEVVRDVVKRMLENLGYKVECAIDGAEAIDKYKKSLKKGKKYDVVIMDLTIPGRMGGKEAIKELRKIDPEVKAIVSSGYSNDAVMSNYKKYGFVGIITKPYTISGLGMVLKEVIEKDLED